MLTALVFVAAGAASDVDAARHFLDRANRELKAAWSARERASFVTQTFINDDTDALAAAADEHAMEVQSRLIAEATKFKDTPNLPADVKRQLSLLVLSNNFPAPSDPKSRGELADIGAWLGSTYGKGKACVKGKCYGQEEAAKVMAESRDEAALKTMWVEWHKIGAPMRDKYARQIELANQGAKQLGFNDTGELWRAGYDMSPAAFSQETDRLWEQLRPFYEQLHCYVRSRLQQKYGVDKVPAGQPIPAHLLGNLWAQEWNNIYPLVEPFKGESPADVTKALAAQKYDAQKMVKLGESFFTSLGFDPLPDTFWTRSQFVRPVGREVVCHASAWDITGEGDVRVKLCLKPTEEDLITVHHELGHDFYFTSYKTLPALFQAGANDGFHEGIGDTLTLSVTPEYLNKIGLAGKPAKNEKALINEQMKSALEKIAFLPFGLLIDRWRWDVFSGKTPPSQYNAHWWELRKRYQGVSAPVSRSEADFDPGAKYHVPGNTPYTRYFLARILQFQLHRGLCKAAGFTGPLYECSIYGNKAAGDKLHAMLALGASKPWPEALEVATGEKAMDASAIMEFYAPLYDWLKKQNEKQVCGW